MKSDSACWSCLLLNSEENIPVRLDLLNHKCKNKPLSWQSDVGYVFEQWIIIWGSHHEPCTLRNYFRSHHKTLISKRRRVQCNWADFYEITYYLATAILTWKKMENDAFSRLEWRIFRAMANVRLAGYEFTHKLNSLISRGAFWRYILSDRDQTSCVHNFIVFIGCCLC